jgi:hypothetical protein
MTMLGFGGFGCELDALHALEASIALPNYNFHMLMFLIQPHLTPSQLPSTPPSLPFLSLQQRSPLNIDGRSSPADTHATGKEGAGLPMIDSIFKMMLVSTLLINHPNTPGMPPHTYRTIFLQQEILSRTTRLFTIK